MVIPTTPSEVFRSWTTEDGAKAFFGAGANIEPTPWRLYEIKLEGELPDGRAPGTAGTRVLYTEPDKAVAFEWQMPRIPR